MQERIYKNFSWFLLLTLAVAAVAVFIPAIGAPLVFDDQFTIVTNPGISAFDYLMQTGGPGEVIRHLDAIFEKNIFRPVLFISLAVNNYLGEGSPAAFRAFNLFLHALNTILVFIAVRRGFEGLSPRYENRGPLLAAACVAACFALHPVQSETAIYITARSSALAFFFMMCSWVLLERLLVREVLGESRRVRDLFRYLLALLLAMVAVLSKETAVVLPVLLLLYDRWIIAPRAGMAPDSAEGMPPAGRPLSRSLMFVSPFIVVAGLFAAFRLSVLGRVEEIEVRPGEFHILATNLKAYWHYFWLWLFPVRLSIDHGFQYEHHLFNLRTVASAAGLALLLYWAWHRRGIAPVATFAVLGAIVTLLPTTGITPLRDILVENRMYGGTVFLGLLLVQAARLFWDVGEGGVKLRVALAVCLLLGAWVWRVQLRTADWTSAVSLWESAASVSAGKSRVHYNLGVAYAYAGREADAFKAYTKAVELDPENYEARLNMASLGISQAFNQTLWDESSVIAMERQLQIARTELLSLSQKGQKRVEALFNLADSYRLEFKPREALYFTQEALSVDPQRAELYELLGKIYEQYAIDPAVIETYDPALWKSRDQWLSEKHRLEEDYLHYSDLAFRAYTTALELGTTNQIEVMKLQARAKLHSGDLEEAERLSYGVLNQAAGDPKVHFNLAVILEVRNRPDLAADFYRTAIQLDPSYALAHLRLARLLERQEDYAGADAHFRLAQNFDDRYQKDYLDFQKHVGDLGVDVTPRFRSPR